ncbi:MAG: DUF2807 domain-containing protein [Bacteroidales bacterium]|nr:DUF2807 domain-containing protein [Bacteroidales bacterium]
MRNYSRKSVLMILALVFTGIVASAQKQNTYISTQTRNLPSFNAIDVGSAITVYLRQSNVQSVKIETSDNLQNNVIATVENNVLKLSAKGMKNYKTLKAYVEVPEIKGIKASGASEVNSGNLLKSDHLNIKASGASLLNLEIEATDLETDLSGASEVRLKGSAFNHYSMVSGASVLKATDLTTRKTDIEISGASHASVNTETELKVDKSGASSLEIAGDPEVREFSGESEDDFTSDQWEFQGNYDSTKVKIGNLNIDVYENNDEVRIKLGNNELFVDEEGNVSFNKSKRKKFNGHWAGFDLGLNGYVNKDGNMSLPKEYEYLDLRMEKSLAAHLNFFEQNVALSGNQKFGLVSGLGFSWNNYRFLRNTRLNTDSSFLNGYIEKGIDVHKTKLTALYLSLPLMFEFQTNSNHKKNSFHIAAGAVMNLRLSSHTKRYYNELNKQYDITQYNPDTGVYETIGLMTSPEQYKTKNFDDYFLAPIKWDASVRIGWGFINLFANYSLNTMFRKDKGPELYPFTVGITLNNL